MADWKQYRQNHKAEYCQYQRDYYWANRERILKQKSDKYRVKANESS